MTAHEALQKAQSIAHDVLAPKAAEVDAKGLFPSDGIAALGKAGLMGLTLPASAGGLGLGPTAFAPVVETLASACASTAMVYVMHSCAAQVIAVRTPTGAQRLLGDLASGTHLATLAFSETGSRSHFWAPISRARAKGDMHLLSADKSFVTSAGKADCYVTSALSVSSGGPTDSTLYWVCREDPGVAVGEPWKGMGLRGNASAPMQLADVELGADRKLGADGEGFKIMLEVVLPWFQLGTASVALGIAGAATAATAEHLKGAKLTHLNESLGNLPTLRAYLARMQIALDQAKALVAQAAASMERPAADTMKLVLESKAAAGDMALSVTDNAMRVCGGAAFAGRVSSVERNFRDSRAGHVMAPTSDVLYEFLGRALLGMPLF